VLLKIPKRVMRLQWGLLFLIVGSAHIGKAQWWARASGQGKKVVGFTKVQFIGAPCWEGS
jgi:hypothetical protein